MKHYVVEKNAIAHNIESVLKRADGTPVWAVVKGNGYGLGLLEMAQALRAAGVDRFAVTEPADAAALRESGSENEQILMLRSTTERAELEQLLDAGAILSVGTYEDAVAINGIAAERETVAAVHLNFDTGMGRYGFLPTELDKVLDIYHYMKNIAVCGIYTHFHSAFCSAKATRAQFETFRAMTARVVEAGYETGELHCCNSSAFYKHPEMHLGGVRIGSALLGRLSFPGSFGLQRVGHAEATIEELRWLPKGHTCGYGAGWKAKAPTRIAVVSIGYYHGFGAAHAEDLFRVRDCLRGILTNLRRILLHKHLFVKIGGQSCRVLGHIGMLHTVIDVTNCSCQLGDVVMMDVNPLMVKGLPIDWV